MNPVFILLRLILPLLILRYPLIGGLVAIILDNLDFHLQYISGISPLGDYQTIDKFLDLYYFSLLAVVATRFKNVFMRRVILGLFIFRIIGIVLFEVTQLRMILFLFPNIFENLFFFYFIIIRVASYEPKISLLYFTFICILVTIPKMMHEYSIHIIQQPLYINIFGYLYKYEGTFHQMIFIGFCAVLFGFYFRIKKNR